MEAHVFRTQDAVPNDVAVVYVFKHGTGTGLPIPFASLFSHVPQVIATEAMGDKFNSNGMHLFSTVMTDHHSLGSVFVKNAPQLMEQKAYFGQRKVSSPPGPRASRSLVLIPDHYCTLGSCLASSLGKGYSEKSKQLKKIYQRWKFLNPSLEAAANMATKCLYYLHPTLSVGTS